MRKLMFWTRIRDNIRSINYPDPSPERRPTNPFTGRPVEGSTDKGKNSPTSPRIPVIRIRFPYTP